MPLYFAYGSNLDVGQMHWRCPSAKLIGAGSLVGYKLEFSRFSTGWRGGVADVILSSRHSVWGLVFDISDDDLERLDSYEGYPTAYTRFQTEIETSPGKLTNVWVYSVTEKQAFVAPTRDYINILINAATKLKFPESYQRFLKQFDIQN